MKRTKAIRLVLLGGGVAAMLAGCGDNDARRRACEEARAQLRPDAEEICRRSTASSSRGFVGSGWMAGRTRTDTSRAAASTSSSSRGGFGSTASSSGGS